MFFFLSKTFDIFLSPYTWALVLLLLAVPWRARSVRRYTRSRTFGAAGFFILLVASSGPVENALTRSLETGARSTYDKDVVYDAVILLGGIVDEEVTSRTGGPAYNENVDRLIVTHRLLRDGKAKFAIVSGAAMDPKLEEFGEARVLIRQLRDWGIDEDRLIVEDHARNTRENAVYSERIVREHGFARTLVVTSAFHVPRARECFEAVGLPVDILPVDYRAHESRWSVSDLFPRAGNLSGVTSSLREIFGRFIYRVQGYGKRPSSPP